MTARIPGRCLLLVALLTACSDDALEPARECFGPLALTVVPGTPPQFTWTASCAVARLAVFETPTIDGSQLAWDVRSDPPRIVSPVRYGQRPGGATEAQAPAVLRPGATYQVRVYNAAQVTIASASFVP
jgi:hypothetical protein